MLEILKDKRVIAAIAISLMFAIFGAAYTLFGKTNASAANNNNGWAVVTSIYVSTENDGTTNVVLKSTKDFSYSVFSLSNPKPRLVVDIANLNWKLGAEQGIINGSGIVKQIRYSRKSNQESRLVFDLDNYARIVSKTVENNGDKTIIKLKFKPTDAADFATIVAEKKDVISTAAVANGSIRRGAGRYTIVIDAGHGGHDPGALGFHKNVFEKNITLPRALLLRDILQKDSRFRVIMTRADDSFLTLGQRIRIARDQKADLFISLHADSAPAGVTAKGATVFTLSEEGGDRAKKILTGDDWDVVPVDNVKDNTVGQILKDLTQRDTKNQSAVFAEQLLKEIVSAGPLTSSSHRRAGFYVLLSPTVPAVLLEMGFVSDEDDEQRLLDNGHKFAQMNGVARAIIQYFNEIDRKANPH